MERAAIVPVLMITIAQRRRFFRVEAETGDFLVTDFLASDFCLDFLVAVVLSGLVFTDFLVLEDFLVIDFEAGARFMDFLVFEEDFLIVDFGFEAWASVILVPEVSSSLLLVSEMLAGLISTDFFEEDFEAGFIWALADFLEVDFGFEAGASSTLVSEALVSSSSLLLLVSEMLAVAGLVRDDFFEEDLVADLDFEASFTDFLVFEEDFLVVVDFGLDFEAGESFILASSLLLLSELLAGLISTDFFAIFA